MRNLVTILSMVAIAAVAPHPIGAQGRPGGPPPTPRPMGIDSATAKTMVAAAEAQAIAQKAQAAIAIVDAVNGDLVAFLRVDGATQVAVVSAEGKARAALLFGVATKVVADSIKAGKPVPLLITTPAVAGGIWGRMVNVSTNQGGMLIRRDGKIIGAIGVGGGGGGDLDDKVAQAGLNALSAR